MEEQETTIISTRKRQLELDPVEQEREGERDSESSPPSAKIPATNSVLDEIELHFQRSLAKMKPGQKSPVPATTATDGSHTPSVVFHSNNQQNRDSPSPNQQSRQTPPISSSSSPRKQGIHSNKSLPPPLKLASPTLESLSTVQSLYPHQHHHPTIRASSVTQHHQTIILPTVTTATGLTNLSRQSPPSSVTGPPALTIANGLPSGGTSPPSGIAYSSGITQIQTLPTISTTLGGVYLASPHVLSSQQAALHQLTLSNGSSSPKRSLTMQAPSSISRTSSAAATTIPVASNSCSGLAAVQLTPGGPILALPSSVLQPSSASGNNSGQARTQQGRTALMTGLNVSNSNTTGSAVTGGGGASYQIHAPSVTQPGSMHIIDLPIDNSAGKTSPPTPLLASAPTLPKAPTVLNVSQIPNLIAINPSSPSSSSSPGSNRSTPTVKVFGVNGSGTSLLSGTQSPIRVSAASAQTTPITTPTVITPQQLAANPSLMSVIDPTVSAQILAGNASGGPMYIIPANSVPMVQQPFFIINPSTTATATDLTSVQQLQQANILASNPSLAGASLVSNPATGGYLLVSPGSGGTATANFPMPLVNLASTASGSSNQPAIPNLIPASPTVTTTTLKPATHNKATVLYSTSSSATASTGGSNIPPPSHTTTKPVPPLKNQSSTDGVPSPAHSDVMMTPASVDDHFAQALGPQWNKLKSHNNMQPQQC